MMNSDNEAEGWHIVNLPAICPDEPPKFPPTCTVEPDWRQPGEALCPERRPLSKLKRIKRRIGEYFWSAVYQQNPQPESGNKFKRDWFRRWRAESVDCRKCYGNGRARGQLCEYCRASGIVTRYYLQGDVEKAVYAPDCRRFGTVDLAVSLKTSADYTVIAAWAVTPDSDIILIDLLRDRFEEPDILKEARRFYRLHDLAYLNVESNGMQLGIVQSMRRGTKDDRGRSRHDGLAVRGIPSKGDKSERAGTAMVAFEAGQVYIPGPNTTAWIGEYENELLSFPNSGHDDMVDVTSLAANDVFRRGASAVETEERQAEKAQVEQEATRKAFDAWSNMLNDDLFTRIN